MKCGKALAEDFLDAGVKFITTRIKIKYIIILDKAGKRRDACDLAEQLLKHHRCDGEIYRSAAIAQFAHGNDNKAIEYVNCAIECDTNEDKAEDIGRCYLLRAAFGCATGNDHVDEDLDLALSHGYNPFPTAEIIRNYSKGKKPADRIEILQIIIGKVR